MMDLVFLAQTEQRRREAVDYPRVNLMGPHEREYQLMQQAQRRNQRRGPASWTGNRLVGAGVRLTAMGEWLARGTGNTTAAG
jgi:hypothetical protein